MKKLLSLALIGALSLSLTACGNNSSKDNSSSKERTFGFNRRMAM